MARHAADEHHALARATLAGIRAQQRAFDVAYAGPGHRAACPIERSECYHRAARAAQVVVAAVEQLDGRLSRVALECLRRAAGRGRRLRPVPEAIDSRYQRPAIEGRHHVKIAGLVLALERQGRDRPVDYCLRSLRHAPVPTSS